VSSQPRVAGQHVQPLVTGWAGGARRVECLGCGRSFVSRSKSNRICPACLKLDRRSGDAEPRGHLRTPP
jgi:hypothetical protein